MSKDTLVMNCRCNGKFRRRIEHWEESERAKGNRPVRAHMLVEAINQYLDRYDYRPTGDYCMDCGRSYLSFRLDLILPNYQWRQITPQVGGLLCANCIMRRAAHKFDEAVAVRAYIDFA